MIDFQTIQAIRQAMFSIACPLDAEARIVLLALLQHFNIKTQQCNPSASTLARETGLGMTTVRDRFKVLEANECLKRTRKHGRACHDYMPLIPPWADISKLAKPSPDVPPTPSKSSPPDTEQEEDSSKKETGQDRVRNGAATRQIMRQLPDDIAMLIRKLQQVPGKPGCAYARLVPKVLETIERCGQAAVEDLYTLIAPQKGEMAPWLMYQMLDGLQAVSDKTAPEESPPLPPDAPLIEEAKAAIQAADCDIRARIAIDARMRAAHVDFMSFWWKDDRHKLAQALARTIASEKGLSP